MNRSDFHQYYVTYAKWHNMFVFLLILHLREMCDTGANLISSASGTIVAAA